MSEDDPEKVQEAARWHVQLKKSFSCTICLDFRMNSASTKCQHSFCRKCIEDWIEKNGTRGRARCPDCNAGGLTKRSLVAEGEVMGRQIALVKKFFEVEMGELKGKLDFLNMTVVNKVSREAEPSPHKPPPPARGSRGGSGLWNKQKVGVNGRKVYGRRASSPEVTVSSGSLEAACISPSLPGEELPGDKRFARERRKRALPKLLEDDKKKSVVENWLDTTVVDPVSQPGPCQAASSTPSLASQGPSTLSPLPLSPLSSNVTHTLQSPRKAKGKKSTCVGSPSVDIFSQLPPSQASVQVDVDDTFDKLLAGGRKYVAPLTREENRAPIFSQQLFSPTNSTPPPLLSPSTSKSILEAVSSPLQPSDQPKKRQFISKSLAKHVEELQAAQPKKSRGKEGKRVSWQEETYVSQRKNCGGFSSELESFSKEDKINGIIPTGRRGGKGRNKFPHLNLVSAKEDTLKKAVNEEINEDRFGVPLPAEEGDLGPVKADCSLERVSETDSQATISSLNTKANCDQSSALTDSIPSEIGNSQTSAREPQMRSARKRMEKVRNAGSQGGEAEIALPAPLSNSSLNKANSDEPRADLTISRESRASFRLDASTMEVDLAGHVPDTMEMTSSRHSEGDSQDMGSDRLHTPAPEPEVELHARNTPKSMESHQVPPPEQKELLALSNHQPDKSGGATKSRVIFSLVGRVKEKRRTRVKGISFLQLGPLASLTPSLQTGPTLQQVVSRHIKEERKAMLPPEETTTPQTGARLAVAHWLNTLNVQTPDSLAPTVLGNGTESSPRCMEPMQVGPKTRACSTLVGSRGFASSPPQASTVPTPRLDSTQNTHANMPDTLSTLKHPEKLTDVENNLGEKEKNTVSSCSIDLDAALAKVVADTEDDDPDKRLSFGKNEELNKAAEMVSKRAAEEIISVGDDDEESLECTDVEQDKEIVMVEEESRELPEVEDDFLEPDGAVAVEEDFMAKILDTQAEFAFTQEREGRIFNQGGDEDGLGEEDILGKRSREESDDEDAPIRAPFKRFRRIESDDEDDDDNAENYQPDTDVMEVGKNTQETIEAMAQAAEEVSQVRREVEEEMEEDLSESRIQGIPSVDQSEKVDEDTKAGLEDENFDLSEECDFLPEEAVEEKEMFEKYEQAAADVPSQEPSLDTGNPEDIKMEKEEVEEKPFEAGSALDSEDRGPGSDVRAIPESEEDLFSQSSTPSLAQSQTSNPSAVQGLPAASRCSPIAELSEDESEVLGNSQRSEEEEADTLVELPDTSNWRFAFSNLSSSARADLPEWADSLGCKGLHSKVDNTVTHLLVKTEGNLETVRTLKYLQAVASGIMVVSESWMKACQLNRADLAKAEQWEARDEELGGVEGPRKSREAKARGEAPLLKGFEVLIKEELDGLGGDSVEDLLKRAGARPVREMNSFSFGEALKLELVESTDWMEEKQDAVLRLLRSYKVATVAKDWLLDTICSHEIRPLAEYTLPMSDIDERLRAAGFPSPM